MLLVGGTALGAAVTLLTVAVVTALRRRHPPAERVHGFESEEQQVGTGVRLPRELQAAWVEFLREDLARAVNALNNRLNVIASLAEDLRGAGIPAEEQAQAEQIQTEVRRAAKITRGLLRRVTPDAPNTVPAAFESLAVSRSMRPAHLLIVEDDPANRSVMTKLFTKLGHRVSAVSNGFEAFELLERTPMDCIICDLRMPSVSGRTLYEQVEKLLPNLSPRFVFVTGDFTRPASREFLDVAGCPVIAKPYETAELLEAVSQVLIKTAVARAE